MTDRTRLARAVPWGAFALSLALVAALAAADASRTEEPLTATLLIGPFLASLLCSLRQTALVALAASAAALASIAWNSDPTSAHHAVRVIAVLIGSAIAVIGARARIRAAIGRSRLLLLADLAELSGRSHLLEEAADRMADLVVHRIADICLLDLATPEGPRRLAARSADDRSADDRPALDEIPPVTHAAPASPVIVRRLRGEEPAATDPGLRALRGAGAASAVIAPIRSEGRLVGLLTLGLGRAPHQQFDDGDLPFLQALAGRIGLVLDNAGLSAELAGAERRFETALDEMDAGVMIQRPDEGIVYANQAAADALELPTPAAVVAATPEEIGRSWSSQRDDGSPLPPDEYPSAQILSGRNLHPPQTLVHGVHRETGRQRWVTVRATPVFDEHGNLEMAVSVTEDVTAIKRGELVQGILARAGEALHHQSEPAEMLQALADLLVPDLADWCAVALRGDTAFDVVAVAHSDPAKVQTARELERRWPARLDAPRGAAHVLRRGAPELVERVTDELLEAAATNAEQLEALRRLGMRSLVQAPVSAPDGPVLGVLSLGNAESGRAFSPGDLELAVELGRRAGVALENARLYRDRTRIAETLQTSLLPPVLPDVPGFELASTYRAAGRETWVGGDFYDVFETPAGWMTVVGDVTGHGAAAAAITAKARHTLRTAGVLTGDPVRALSLLNGQLCRRREIAMCSACIVLLPDGGGDVVRIACAGHPRPVRVHGGGAEEVGSWGTMLGAFADTAFTVEEVAFAPGDTLLVYTDGVTDARGRDERFGDERLLATVAPAAGAHDAVRRLERALDGFSVGEQADDTAVVAIHRRVAPGPDVAYGDPGGAEREISAVRAIYDAANRGDVDGVLRHLAPDAELHLRVTGERAGREGPYVGHEGVRQWFADVERVWDEFELHPDDVRAAAHAVVVFGRAFGRQGDEVVRRRTMWTWNLRDGVVVTMRANDLGPIPAP